MKKKRKDLLLLVIAFFAFVGICSPVFCKENHIPVLDLKKCSMSPLIDADLNDQCWRNASEINNWYKVAVDDKLVVDNSQKAFVCTDNQWLYIAFDITHPAPSTIIPAAKKHDGRVQIENCVKILFDPGTDFNPWYIFRLSAGNIKADQRNMQASGKHQKSWDIPWRSATKKNAEGWTAEIAIPLFCLYDTGNIDSNKTRLDLIVSSIEPMNGDLENMKKVFYSWSPVRFRYWDEPTKFGFLKGLDLNKIKAPFLPQVKKSSLVGGYKLSEDGQLYYTLDTVVAALTGVSGKAFLQIKDIPVSGKASIVSKEINLEGDSSKQLKIDVPINVLSKRDIQVSLVSAVNGDIWQTFHIENPQALNVLSAYSRMSYYTSEKNAQIICNVSLSKKILANSALVVLDNDGCILASVKGLSSEHIIDIPLSKLAEGKSVLTIRLDSQDGSPIGVAIINVTKLPPSKGSEVKIDYLTTNLIRNGEAFIPFGIYGVPDTPEYFKAMHEADMNFAEMQLDGKKNIFQYQRNILKHAGEHDIQLVMRPYRYTLDKKLDVSDLVKGHMKNELTSIVKGIPTLTYYPEKNILEAHPFEPLHFRLPVLRQKLGKRVASGLYNRFLLAHLDYYSEIIKTCKDYPSTLCYMLCDEPVLPLLDEDIAGMALEKRYKEIDPYHPSMVNYCGLPPDVSQAITFADIICADVYTNEVKFPFYLSYKVAKRCRKYKKIPWIILEGRPSAGKMLSPKQQTAQFYASLIGGVKGFQYFIFPIISRVLWNNLSRLASDLKLLKPFIVTQELQQNINYTPGDYSLDTGKIPDVVAGLFKSEYGRYLLLVVNCMEYPVDIDMTLPFAIQNAQAKCLRNEKTIKLSANKLTETLESLAVRAYVFDEDSVKKQLNTESFKMKLVINSYKELAPRPPAPLDRFSGDKKNMMVNTSMENATLPGWPDYYIPVNLYRAQLEEKFQLDTENPFHGKQSLRMNAEKGETFGFYIIQGAHGGSKSDPYLGDPNIEYTLSVYMRSDGKGARISMKSEKQKGKVMGMMTKGNVYDTVQPPSEWTRYSWKITMPALLWFRITGPGTVWIDAFQLEKSEKPTEYEHQ